MNKLHGIRIQADAQIVDDVYASVWNGQEIRDKLSLHNEEVVFQDFRNDSIVLEALPNGAADGGPSRKNGFILFERRFYGNALIIPDEERDTPRISPQEVAHVIRFFSEE